MHTTAKDLNLPTTSAGVIEYALLVQWESGPEVVPARDAEHAERMAATLYAHRPTWTIGRELPPWQYARRGTATLSGQVVQ
jgi:hypothetical protein